MPRRRLPLALLWPTGLVLLVGVLAFFQYKWLGQVSESERDRLRTTLNQRAREFTDEFDREISRAYLMLQLDPDPDHRMDGESYARRFDAWKDAARFPGMVRDIYITTDAGAATPLLKFSSTTRTFTPSAWPTTLKSVEERLATFTRRMHSDAIPGTVQFVSMGQSPVVSDVPALLMPTPSIQRLFTGRPLEMLNITIQPTYVIVELDRAYLTGSVLPALVERHFALDEYRVEVVDAREPTQPFYMKGITSGHELDLKHADATLPFFSVRADSLRDALTLLKPAGTQTSTQTTTSAAPASGASSNSLYSIVVQQRSTPSITIRDTPTRVGVPMSASAGSGSTIAVTTASAGGWQLVLQHSAGSLEAAVSRARIRNLSLSFGVLAVLAAGVFLISINAQRAQRLAAQQIDFVATVSHELRTPLAVIRSAAQNLSAGVVHEPAQAKRYGDLIDAEGRRLTDMIEQVLTYAGLTDNNRPATTSPSDIVVLTRDVVASCDSLIRDAGFTCDVTTADSIPDVPLDEAAFRRALNNLIVNALKYGTDGAWLGVDVAMGTRAGGAQEVRVTVSDRGRGIDAADLPHIFEAFYRGEYAKERQIHGNGLGLSLVKGIAEAHGGRVTVVSTPGAGAAFTLHLPL